MADGGRVTVVGYRTAGDRDGVPPAMQSLAFRVALACWAVPLTAGLATLAASLVNLPETMTATFALTVVIFGVLLSAVGAIAAVTFAAGRWSAAHDHWRDCVRPAVILLLLLTSNYAFGFVCYMAFGAQV